MFGTEKRIKCRHQNKHFERVLFTRSDGVKGEHIREICAECGANPRGVGIWVGRAELLQLGIAPATLPIKERTKTLSMFGGTGGVE